MEVLELLELTHFVPENVYVGLDLVVVGQDQVLVPLQQSEDSVELEGEQEQGLEDLFFYLVFPPELFLLVVQGFHDQTDVFIGNQCAFKPHQMEGIDVDDPAVDDVLDFLFGVAVDLIDYVLDVQDVYVLKLIVDSNQPFPQLVEQDEHLGQHPILVGGFLQFIEADKETIVVSLLDAFDYTPLQDIDLADQ